MALNAKKYLTFQANKENTETPISKTTNGAVNKNKLPTNNSRANFMIVLFGPGASNIRKQKKVMRRGVENGVQKPKQN